MSNKALIEELRRLQTAGHKCEQCDNVYCGHVEKFVNGAIAALEAQEWVSVDDRLPEAHGEYLASRRCRPLGWVCTYASVGWIVNKDYPITHWMPLPTPPQEEEK